MAKKNLASVGFSGFISAKALEALNNVLQADHALADFECKRTKVDGAFVYEDDMSADDFDAKHKELADKFAFWLEKFRDVAVYERKEIVFGSEQVVKVKAFDALDIECKNGSISATTVLPVVISMGLCGHIETTKDKDFAKALAVSNDLARRVNARLESADHKKRAFKRGKDGVRANATIRRGKVASMVTVFYAEIVEFYRQLCGDTNGKACNFNEDGTLWVKDSNIVK